MQVILGYIAAFIGKILALLFGVLLKEGKKQRKVVQAGYDEELQEDMENDLEKQIMNVKQDPPVVVPKPKESESE